MHESHRHFHSWGTQAIYTYVELDETFMTLKFDQQDAKETLNAEWLILNGAWQTAARYTWGLLYNRKPYEKALPKSEENASQLWFIFFVTFSFSRLERWPPPHSWSSSCHSIIPQGSWIRCFNCCSSQPVNKLKLPLTLGYVPKPDVNCSS